MQKCSVVTNQWDFCLEERKLASKFQCYLLLDYFATVCFLCICLVLFLFVFFFLQITSNFLKQPLKLHLIC